MATFYNPISTFINDYPSVVGLAFGNGNNVAPTRIDFVDDTSQETIDAVNTAAASFDWVPLAQPNIQGFITAVESDSSLTSILELIVPFYAAIENYTADPQVVKTAWTELQTTYSSQLTPDIVTTIETYANNNGVPLT